MYSRRTFRMLVPLYVGGLVLLGECFSPTGFAAQRTWIGGNADWLDNGSTANWNPADEPDADDEAIFNTPNFVHLGSDNLILALTMSGGVDLFTNDFDLNVDGLVQLSGASTNLFIGGAGGLVDADDVTVNSSAVVELAGGLLQLDEESGTSLLLINSGGTVLGTGRINFADLPTTATTLLNNNGTLTALSRPASAFVPPPVGTLRIDGGFIGGRVDLDGSNETGIVNVNRNQTLDLNVALADSFNGTMNLFHNATFDSSSAWTLSGGFLFANNGFVDNSLPNPDIPADVSFIRGGAVTQTGGTIDVVDTDGTLHIDANFTMSGGQFLNRGKAIFNGTTNITSSAGIQMLGTSPQLEVGGAMNISAPGTIDWDGLESATTTVRGNGSLSLNVFQIDVADNDYQGTINLNDDADLSVNVAASTSWRLLGGTINKNNAGTSVVSGDQLRVTNGAINVNAGTLVLPTTEISVGSAINVNSELHLGNASAFLAPATITGPGHLVFDGTTTTSANTIISVNTLDWDGLTNAGTHTILDGVSLTINSTSIDGDGNMGDGLSLGGNGAALIVNGPTVWSHAGVFTANATASGTATIGGTSRFRIGGTLNVDGNTNITAPVQFGSGSTTQIDPGMTLDVQADALYTGGTITGPGQFRPGNTLNTVVADTTISTQLLNFGEGAWVVESGAQLTINVADYSLAVTNEFDNIITLNNGGLVVLSGDPKFVKEGVTNMNASLGEKPFWAGQPLDFGDDVGANAVVNVTGDGVAGSVAQFGVPVTFRSDADVRVFANAVLQFTSAAPVTFETVNGLNSARFQGAGTISSNAAVTVNEAVTLDMVGGRVDLDGTDNSGDVVQVNAPLTIHAAVMESFGRVNGSGGNNILNIDRNAGTGSLTVTLDDPDAKWTLNAPSVLNLSDNLAVAGTLISGNDVNMNGTVNVSASPIIGARIDFGSTAVVNITTSSRLTLAGGGSNTADSNTINGATINGPGLLNVGPGKGLVGFGTINAPIDFDGGVTDLEADNGMLTVNGVIVDVARIGPVDADGILNVPAAWNSIVAETVRLRGGEFRGGTITIDNPLGVRGFGLMSSRLVNNSQIVAESGTLTVQTAANDNDWDGGNNVGQLGAINGATLRIQDNAAFPFRGSMAVLNGGRVESSGFELEFEPGSFLHLEGATYESSHRMLIGGQVNLNGGSDSSLIVTHPTGQPIIFEATSATTLNANLRLRSPNSFVIPLSGATFTGSGAMIVENQTALIPANGAEINTRVILEAGSSLSPQNAASIGRVDMLHYQQLSGARLLMEILGPAPGSFDQVVLDGTAQLAGRLDVDLINGFLPINGQTFELISASGGVTGTFDEVNLPAMAPILRMDVKYLPTQVQLAVLPSGDFNGDRAFNCSDVDALVMQVVAGGASAAFDMNGDGSVNGADLSVWLTQAGAANLASGHAYLLGDANLDGVVDGSDFVIWNSHKFTAVAAWCSADFNADGVVDGSDFVIWNSNKFTSSDSGQTVVPEPTTSVWFLAVWIIGVERRRQLAGGIGAPKVRLATSGVACL